MANENRANMIEGLLRMPDDELIRWTLSGEHPEGYIAELGRLVIDLRCSTQTLKVTVNMPRATKNLAIATWAVALITLVTQAALIVMFLRH